MGTPNAKTSMKNYVLDTNILIHIVRDSKHWRKINDLYDPFRHVSHLSFAAVAEAVSFAKRTNWSERKIESLKSVVRSFDVLHSDDGLIEDYIEIDVFIKANIPP